MSMAFALNHICRPLLSAEDLLRAGAALGLGGVEFRNDLSNPDPLTGQDPSQIRSVARDLGQSIISINALQRFNDPDRLGALKVELSDLVQTASQVGAQAVVLCPVHGDPASPAGAENLQATRENLQALAPVFEDAGVMGFVEPLGLPGSTLSSHRRLAGLLDGPDMGCYKMVLDTFHLALGPDEVEDIACYPVELIGLVHISGVEAGIPFSEFGDEHRVFVTASDRLDNRLVLRELVRLGYEGPVSMEAFSSEIQSLPESEFHSRLTASLRLIAGDLGLHL